MSSDYRHELQCLRLSADCNSLADDIDDPALQKHYRRMAEIWSNLADPDRAEKLADVEFILR